MKKDMRKGVRQEKAPIVMTELQALHHEEQMEATRQEFLKWWRELGWPYLQRLNVQDENESMIAGWLSWLAARKGVNGIYH